MNLFAWIDSCGSRPLTGYQGNLVSCSLLSGWGWVPDGKVRLVGTEN